jgi:RNA polymerase sigma-70 factor (ECF subfamily)
MTGDKQAVYQQLLLLRAQRGDTGALEELIGLWEPRLFYYVRRLVEQEADAWDVLQKTWLKVMRRIKTLRDPAALPRWLYTLARNTAFDDARARRADHLSLGGLEDYEEPRAGQDEQLDFEDAEAVHRALGRISTPHREVLTLFFLRDLSVEEIGEVIGAPPGTVKSRLCYARRALREQMEQEGKR